MSGVLYIVATPIGHLDDVSVRARVILQEVDCIACEDTRHSRRLLQHYGIETPLLALHQHNERGASELLLVRLLAGESVALVSDAGTPLVSDPGAILVGLAHESGVRVVPIPGASSVMAALSASGLSANQFMFAGFIPAKSGERLAFLRDFSQLSCTCVFFEAPHRVQATFAAMQAVLDGDRVLVVARELTKQFEEIVRLTVGEALQWLQGSDYRERGEFVLLLEGVSQVQAKAHHWQKMALDLQAVGVGAKAVSNLVSEYCGVKKKVVYQFLIAMKEEE